MTITNVKATPLLVRNQVPYYWAAGVRYGAEVILIEVHRVRREYRDTECGRCQRIC